MVETSLNKYASQCTVESTGNRRRRWRRGKLAAWISQPDVPKFSASDGVAREGMKEKGIRRKAAPSRREGGRQNWNFFARAATQQLIKSLNVSLSGWCCCCCPSLALFSQYKLSLFPHFACRLTTAPFSTHPDTAQTPRHPSRRCLRLATFTPRN